MTTLTPGKLRQDRLPTLGVLRREFMPAGHGQNGDR